MKIALILACLLMASCAETTRFSSGAVLASVSDFPDYTDRSNIVRKLGYPTEVILHEADRPASKGPSFDWIYYLKSSENGIVARFVYTFKGGKCVGATYLTVPKGGSYRILDSNNESDLRIILDERKRAVITSSRLKRN